MEPSKTRQTRWEWQHNTFTPSLHLVPFWYNYPTRACAKGLSNQFCPSVSQSVSLSVSPLKNFEISTFTRLKDCYTQQWHGNLKKNNGCVPDRDQSSSLFCISSSFLFNIGIIHHFDMVNHLDTVETGHVVTPSMCSCHQPPCSRDGEKLGGGLGTRQHNFNTVNTSDTVESGYTRIRHVSIGYGGVRAYADSTCVQSICEKQGDFLEAFILTLKLHAGYVFSSYWHVKCPAWLGLWVTKKKRVQNHVYRFKSLGET